MYKYNTDAVCNWYVKCYKFIKEDLNMHKMRSNTVLNVISDEQREKRVGDSKEIVDLITFDPRAFESVVTCVESWIYCNGTLLTPPVSRRRSKSITPRRSY